MICIFPFLRIILPVLASVYFFHTSTTRHYDILYYSLDFAGSTWEYRACSCILLGVIYKLVPISLTVFYSRFKFEATKWSPQQSCRGMCENLLRCGEEEWNYSQTKFLSSLNCDLKYLVKYGSSEQICTNKPLFYCVVKQIFVPTTWTRWTLSWKSVRKST